MMRGGRGRGRGAGRGFSRGFGRGRGRGRSRFYTATARAEFIRREEERGIFRAVKGPDGVLHPVSYKTGDVLDLSSETGNVVQVLHNRMVRDKIKTVKSCAENGLPHGPFVRALTHDLSLLGRLPNVEVIELKRFLVTTLHGLEPCSRLRELHVCAAYGSLCSLGSIGRLAALETLTLEEFEGPHVVELAESTSLRVIKFTNCNSLESIAGLERIPTLEHLEFNCSPPVDVSLLRHSPSLRRLVIGDNGNRNSNRGHPWSFAGLGFAPRLEELDLRFDIDTDFNLGADLCHSQQLRRLRFRGVCSSDATRFNGIERIPTLEAFEYHARDMHSDDLCYTLSRCAQLTSISLRGVRFPEDDLEYLCKRLTKLTNLQIESAHFCSLAAVCGHLAHARALTSLSLNHCRMRDPPQSDNVQPLSLVASMPSLTRLDISGGRSFAEYAGQLAVASSNLKWIDVSFTRITAEAVKAFAVLPHLEELRLIGCPLAGPGVVALKHVPLVLAGKASTAFGVPRTAEDAAKALEAQQRDAPESVSSRGRGGDRGRGRGRARRGR